MSNPGWPVELTDGPVTVRPLRWSDARAWREVRRVNHGWLVPWEATQPGQRVPAPTLMAYAISLLRLRRHARAGEVLPFVVTYHGRLVGQLTVGGISRRSRGSPYVGYWVDRRYAGRGITPTALALVVDHCFTAMGLDRLEANVRPENAPSRRVAEKLGFGARDLRRRFLFIDGDWRDHICYVITPEDVPEGMVNRWHARRAAAL